MEKYFKRSNRDKRMEAKKDKFWCGKCDCQLIGEYGKCPNCGWRSGVKRLKKPYN